MADSRINPSLSVESERERIIVTRIKQTLLPIWIDLFVTGDFRRNGDYNLAS